MTTQQQSALTMKCIEDGSELEPSTTSGEPSMRCPQCNGAWLTDVALYAVEDKTFDPEMVKGQRRYGEQPTEHPCPHCGKNMTRFRYRGYNLEIEACPEGAGYWLDHGEDRNIKDLLKTRERNLNRTVGAEQAWQKVRRGKPVSIMDRIRSIFRR